MKKQLLQESEIRKMMKFANIGALSNDFIERLDESVETGELDEGQDDEMDEGMHGKRDDELDEQEVPGAEAMDDEEEMDDESGMEAGDLEGDMPAAEAPADPGALPPEAAEELEGLVDGLKAVLALAGEDGKKMADALSVEREGGDMDKGDEPEMPMGDESEMAMADEPDPMGGDAETMAEDEDMMLEEVARRVARRLRRMKRR